MSLVVNKLIDLPFGGQITLDSAFNIYVEADMKQYKIVTKKMEILFVEGVIKSIEFIDA